MYWIFLKITFLTYFFIFVVRSLINNLFNSVLYQKMSMMIDNNTEEWVKENCEDEWIMGKLDPNVIMKIKDKDIENDMENEDMELDFTSLQGIMRMVFNENSNSFSILTRSVIGLMFVKSMFYRGHLAEVLLGLTVGTFFHFGFLIVQLFKYLQGWYFGDKTGFKLEDGVLNKSIIPSKLVMFFPILPIFLLNIIRANVYSRVIGEWLVDVNMFYFYISQLFGYMLIQNMIRIVDYSRKSASVLIIFIVYSLLILAF